MNPFLKTNFSPERQGVVSVTEPEHLPFKENYFVARIRDADCTITNINILPELIVDPEFGIRQDSLWILVKLLKYNEQGSSGVHHIDYSKMREPLIEMLKDIDLESSFLSLKSILGLLGTTNIFEFKTDLLFDNVLKFVENFEAIQFQSLKIVFKILQHFEEKTPLEILKSIGAILARKLLKIGKSLLKIKLVDANLDFLTAIRNSFDFFEKMEMLTNEKLVKIFCEYLKSENKNERLLALEILLSISKTSKGSKYIVKKISFKDLDKLLDKDKSHLLIFAVITLVLNLTQQKKDLQEKIMEYPSILQSFVHFFENALVNAAENKNLLLSLAELLAILVEYPPIKIQVSQYGIYSALSLSQMGSRDSRVKEEILRLIDKLASLYQDYELIFQSGMIDFISQNITSEKDELIEDFVDFMIKAANSQYLTKKNLGLEQAMNLEEIVKKTKNAKIRQKVDDLHVLLDKERAPKNPYDLNELQPFSMYHVNSEKVKYQQLLNFKIESLVGHIVKTQRPRNLDNFVDKMISSLDLQLQTLDLNAIKEQAGLEESSSAPSLFKHSVLLNDQRLHLPQQRFQVQASSQFHKNLDSSKKQSPERMESPAMGNTPQQKQKAFQSPQPYQYEPQPSSLDLDGGMANTEMNEERESFENRRAHFVRQYESKTETDENYFPQGNPKSTVKNNPLPVPQGRSNYSRGKTRPVKPVNLNNSGAFEDTSQKQTIPSRNLSRERRTSVRQLSPLIRNQKNQANIGEKNNYSMIEAYNQEYNDSSFPEKNMNLSFNQPYYEDTDHPITLGRGSLPKQEGVKLPSIKNSSSIFNNRASDYGLAIEETKETKPEKKLSILPKIETFPFSEIEGIDQLIADKYLNTDFTNVKLKSSKMLRHYLKMGIPEARGISNITGANSVKGLILWFSKRIMQQDHFEVIEHLQTAIGSPSRTAFLVCMVVSLGEKQGISFDRFKNDERVVIE